MKNISLQLAKDVTGKANKSWESGEMIEHVTPVTRDLLTYWFDESFASERDINFHEGQRQAILNTIYLHEIVQVKKITDVYQHCSPDLLLEAGAIAETSGERWDVPKYAIKMATGTGKTWVLQALLIWQYLNAKEQPDSDRYTNNFLVVAPGLIVYERLIDALRGKRIDAESLERDFDTTDMYTFREVFLPEQYRDSMFGFLRNAVATKDDLLNRGSADGVIALTNWHTLVLEKDDERDEAPGADVDTVQMIQDILPARPGSSAGNSLDVLDRSIYGNAELEYLRNLNNLVVFNDEAHRVKEDSKWEESLRYIAEAHDFYAQFDFSATPYIQKGTASKTGKIKKEFFPHIIVDFDLKQAILKGFVKTLVLNRRQEIGVDEELDFRAERDENRKIIGLSEGQRLMLRAGMKKLRLLEEEFTSLDPKKHPKMMVVCEETEVVPYVADFLKDQEGLDGEDIIEVHSSKKGELKTDEWDRLKGKLFGLDKHTKPRVVVSVLMLREGFDVNNICVIVPLRSSQSGILLEQTIGRGLRLMWREPEYQEAKEENRKRVLQERIRPKNEIEVLNIIEHPRFLEFYDELIADGLAVVEGGEDDGETSGVGDFINVELRDDYEKYNFQFPVILRESEKIIEPKDFDVEKLQQFPMSFEEIKKILPKGERFVSQEVTSGTRYGDFDVHSGVMSATSYNDYVSRLVRRVMTLVSEKSEDTIKARRNASEVQFPLLQLYTPQIAGLVDTYLKKRLFGQEIDPHQDDNWRVFMMKDVAEAVVKNITTYIIKIQEETEVNEYEMMYRNLSEVTTLRMRESSSLETHKTIYDRTSFPTRSGNLEKSFIEYANTDGEVDAFAKIVEYKHTFIQFKYIREDGMLAHYHPDFLVRIGNQIYIVETKSEKDTSHPNVKRKKKSVLNWVEKINKLPEEHRQGFVWSYVLLGEDVFYDFKNKGAAMKQLLDYATMRYNSGINIQGKFL